MSRAKISAVPGRCLATVALLAMTLLASPFSHANSLNDIKARGKLIVGVKKDVPLWGYQDPRSGEISGMEGQIVTMQDLFRFRHEGVDAEGRVRGQIMPTGIQPRFLERLTEMGVTFASDLFSQVRG